MSFGLVLLAALAGLGCLLGVVGGAAMYRLLRRLQAERTSLLREKEVIYNFVQDVGAAFGDADMLDRESLLKRILFYAMRTAHASAGAIYVMQRDRATLQADMVAGLFPPLDLVPGLDLEAVVNKSQRLSQLVRGQIIMKGQGLVGEVADLGAPLLVADAERDPRVPHYAEEFLGIQSLLLVPLQFQQTVLGVVALVNRADGRPFTQADLNLIRALADQSAVTMHFALLRADLEDKRRLDYDLEVARRIQRLLLPSSIPRLPAIELAAVNHPAWQVGGDYYDFIPVDAEHLGVAIADVSGKGVSGAIIMAAVRMALRAQAPGKHHPAEVLRAVNHLLADDLAADMFVSMVYLVLNHRTGTGILARAGHEGPFVARVGGALDVLAPPGVALGLRPAATFDALLGETGFVLQPGDVLVAYTDGVTEAMNGQGEEWGLDRFAATVRRAAAEGAHSVLNQTREALLRFVGNLNQYDDMTLIALRWLR